MAEAPSSWKGIPRFRELVVELSLEKYKELPKKGKPLQGEWTPLATVLCCRGDCSAVGSVHMCSTWPGSFVLRLYFICMVATNPKVLQYLL